MWVDSDGAAHTAALPEPTMLMTPEFAGSLLVLAANDAEGFHDILDDCETAVFEAISARAWDPVVEAQYEREVPPVVAGDQLAVDLDSLRQVVEEIELRWRLDVISANHDLLMTESLAPETAEGSMSIEAPHAREGMQVSLDDPRHPVVYNPRFREYGMLALDGDGVVTYDLLFCPYCGLGLPGSLREPWFERLFALGLDVGSPDIPADMLTDAWWKGSLNRD